MSPCILCIEDETTLLADVAEELTAAGYRVISATSAEQALALLDAQHPDLILCDVLLGTDDGRDGYFIHQHIRERRPDLKTTPFIFLTALGHRSALLEAKRQGVDDYLVKPIDYDMLLATISSRLAQVGRLHDPAAPRQGYYFERLSEVFAQLPGAVLLCDRDGQLLYANPQAERLAREEQIWQRTTQGRVHWAGVVPASLQALQQMMLNVSTSVSGERRMLALERHMADSPVLVSLLCLEPEPEQKLLALFICSAHSRALPDLDALRLMFSLTPSEARVALLLAEGRRRDEVARELGVSASTVAFHLRNLFLKTGVSRQSDLVALVLVAGWSLPGLCGPGDSPQ